MFPKFNTKKRTTFIDTDLIVHMIQIHPNNLASEETKSEGAPCNSGPAVFYTSPSGRRRSLCRTDYYGRENAKKTDAFRDATSNATVRAIRSAYSGRRGMGREELAPSVRPSIMPCVTYYSILRRNSISILRCCKHSRRTRR